MYIRCEKATFPVFQLGQNRRALALLALPGALLAPLMPQLISVVVWLCQTLLSINLPV